MIDFNEIAHQLVKRARYLAGACFLLCIGAAFDASTRLPALKAAVAVMWLSLYFYWQRTAIREARMLRNAQRHLSED